MLAPLNHQHSNQFKTHCCVTQKLDANNVGLEGELQKNGEVDTDIVEQMASLGFAPEMVRDSLSHDKYDVAGSTYYLLLARKLKNKGIVEYVLSQRRFPLHY